MDYQPHRDLDTPNQGEDMMQMFIQQHMMNILSPIAEHVRGLQAQVDQILHDVPRMNGDMEKHEHRLDHCEQKLTHLWTNLMQSNARVDGLRNDLMKLAEECHTLEAQHEVTKAALSRADGVLQATASSALELKQNLKNSDAHIRMLQIASAETNKHLTEGLEPGLQQVREFHDALNERQLDVIQDLQQTRQFSKTTNEALKEFMKTFEQQRKDDSKRFGRLADQTTCLDAGLADVNHRLQTQCDHLSTTNTDVRQLKASLEQTTGALQGLDSQHSETVRAVQDTMSRMSKAEEGITQGSMNLSSEKNYLLDLVQDQGTKLGRTIQDVSTLDSAQRSHLEHLQTIDHRTSGLELRAKKSDEQSDSLDRHLKGLGVWQSKAMDEIDSLQTEHKKTAMHLHTTSRALDVACSKLHGVSCDLDTTNDNMGRMGQRVDLAHQYFGGLSKGFQNTHKRVVAGEDGMLPPKVGSGLFSLPSISAASPRNPTSPRTPGTRT
eukprot:CAMPEP_0194513130 /NCGR_PEP_ID=MMETSP0253-20130528/45321_1 /TAXON_ID=2966 /ORGANISM="Noctiluca scintillans" /LENGTH=493 /DNA_ID=CAMNT_0039356651 /DNA_START=23 /DNA_END=1504 /DNA_ORIENTATION=+